MRNITWIGCAVVAGFLLSMDYWRDPIVEMFYPTIPCSEKRVGSRCADGTYYIGTLSDSAIPLYATGADEPGTYGWSGSGKYLGGERNIKDMSDGFANTKALAQFGAQYHPAATHCWNLEAHGHDDWYVPAVNELNLLWNDGEPIADVVLPPYNWSNSYVRKMTDIGGLVYVEETLQRERDYQFIASC